MVERIRKWGSELQRPKLFVFSFALIVALLFLVVIWPNQSKVIRADDPYWFSVLGRSIAEGRGFAQLAHPDLPTMRRAPLYPAFIALLYFLAGPHTVLVRLAQCVFAAGTATLTFAIGERVFSRSVGLLAALLVTFHPMVLRYVPDLQVEATLTFFMTLMVWCGLRFVDEPTVKRGFALGAVGALGALIKGVLVICPPLFACWWLVQQWRRGKGLPLVPVIAIAAAMCVVILPWTARNYKVTGGHFVLISTNAGGEFLRGYVFAQPKYYLLEQPPYLVGEQEANQMEIDLFKAQNLVWERDEMETETVVSKAAKLKLKNEPGAFVRKAAIGVFTFWYELTTPTNSLIVGGAALLSWLLAGVGLRRARLQHRETWPLLLPIVAVNLLYAALLALGRYSAPTIPTLMVMAAWGIACLLGWDETKTPLEGAAK